jgi:hypothetical protein
MLGERGDDCRWPDIHRRDYRAHREAPSKEWVQEVIIPKPKSKGGIMGQVTHEQVNLLLRLYDMRREPRLREAREWFSANFHVKGQEDVMGLYPPGSRENANMRMVLGYWEMVASIANRGLVDEDLFFENSGEQWGVWEQVKPVIGAWRTMFSSPKFLGNLEEHCTRLEAWREKHNPGSNAAMRKIYEQMQQAMQGRRAQAAAD